MTDYTKYYLKTRKSVVLGIAKVNEKGVLHWGETVDLLNSLEGDVKHLEEYCGDLESDVKRLIEENKQLKEKSKDANDEVEYWKDIVGRYRNSAQLDLEECTIIQGNKKYVGKVKCFVKYENHSSIDLYDLKEVNGDEYE